MFSEDTFASPVIRSLALFITWQLCLYLEDQTWPPDVIASVFVIVFFRRVLWLVIALFMAVYKELIRINFSVK